MRSLHCWAGEAVTGYTQRLRCRESELSVIERRSLGTIFARAAVVKMPPISRLIDEGHPEACRRRGYSLSHRRGTYPGNMGIGARIRT
jgi:hypothetical protein